MATSDSKAPVVGEINERGVPNNEWDVYWWQQAHKNDATNPAGEASKVTGIQMYGSPSEVQGEAAARQNASIYYGSPSEIGEGAALYRGMVRSNLNSPSGLANRSIQAANQDIAKANARSGLAGVDTSAANIRERRNAITNADQIQQGYNQQNLRTFGQSIGAGISGTESMAAAGAGKAIANKPIQTPNYGGGTLGCLALVSVGLMSKETYASEASFVNKESLEYIGYAILVTPIVPLIMKNGKIARIFSFFAHKYVLNLTGEKVSFTGKMIAKIGNPICRFVAGVKNVRA